MTQKPFSVVSSDQDGLPFVFFEGHHADAGSRGSHEQVWRVLLDALAADRPGAGLLVACAAPTCGGGAGVALRELLACEGKLYLPTTAVDLTDGGYINLEMLAEYTPANAMRLNWHVIRQACWLVRVMHTPSTTAAAQGEPDWSVVQGEIGSGVKYIESERNDESLFAYGFGDASEKLSRFINESLRQLA